MGVLLKSSRNGGAPEGGRSFEDAAERTSDSAAHGALGEFGSFRGPAVDVGCASLPRTVLIEIAVAEVVEEDRHEVRCARRSRSQGSSSR